MIAQIIDDDFEGVTGLGNPNHKASLEPSLHGFSLEVYCDSSVTKRRDRLEKRLRINFGLNVGAAARELLR